MSDCGHIIHIHCLMRRLKMRWFNPRIEFGYLDCVGCKVRISAPHCPQVHAEIIESQKIEEDI